MLYWKYWIKGVISLPKYCNYVWHTNYFCCTILNRTVHYWKNTSTRRHRALLWTSLTVLRRNLPKLYMTMGHRMYHVPFSSWSLSAFKYDTLNMHLNMMLYMMPKTLMRKNECVHKQLRGKTVSFLAIQVPLLWATFPSDSIQFLLNWFTKWSPIVNTLGRIAVIA